jgi:hypothetical protein
MVPGTVALNLVVPAKSRLNVWGVASLRRVRARRGCGRSPRSCRGSKKVPQEHLVGVVVEALRRADEPPDVAQLRFEHARDPSKPCRHRPPGDLPARLGKPLAEHCGDVDERQWVGRDDGPIGARRFGGHRLDVRVGDVSHVYPGKSRSGTIGSAPAMICWIAETEVPGSSDRRGPMTAPGLMTASRSRAPRRSAMSHAARSARTFEIT